MQSSLARDSTTGLVDTSEKARRSEEEEEQANPPEDTEEQANPPEDTEENTRREPPKEEAIGKNTLRDTENTTRKEATERDILRGDTERDTLKNTDTKRDTLREPLKDTEELRVDTALLLSLARLMVDAKVLTLEPNTIETQDLSGKITRKSCSIRGNMADGIAQALNMQRGSGNLNRIKLGEVMLLHTEPRETYLSLDSKA